MAVQSRLALMASPPGVTDLVAAPLFASAAFILMLVVPLITMRLVSEERRSRTLPLLFSAPVSMTEIILGKYLGILAFLGIMLTLVALMPLSLLVGGTLDPEMLTSGLLGLLLMLAAFAAAGLFMSTLTAQPTVAAAATFGLLLLLWVIDWAGARSEGARSGLLSYLSMQHHYQALLRGMFDTADVAYFLLFILVFLVFSIRRLDAERLRG